MYVSTTTTIKQDYMHLCKGIGRKISRGEETKKKRPKIALLNLYRGGGEATEKRPKNSAIKPLAYICTTYENPGGGEARPTFFPMLTPMQLRTSLCYVT